MASRLAAALDVLPELFLGKIHDSLNDCIGQSRGFQLSGFPDHLYGIRVGYRNARPEQMRLSQCFVLPRLSSAGAATEKQGRASRLRFGMRGIQFGMAADVICLLTNYNPSFVWRDSETTEIAPHL
jgi:hypothetical protein